MYYNCVSSVIMHHHNIAKGTWAPEPPHHTTPPPVPLPAVFVAVAAPHAQATAAGSFSPSSGSFGKGRFIKKK